MLPSWLPFVVGTVCVYGLAGATALPNTHPPMLPPNIIVDRPLDAVVARMLHRSPTFRDQANHLGSLLHLRIRVIVRLSLGPSGQSLCRADAVMRKYQFGRIDALVRVPSIAKAPELVAHEFEHVREYTEGVNFRLLAARVDSGVWHTRSGHYETARAVAIGRRVAEEVEPGSAPH